MLTVTHDWLAERALRTPDAPALLVEERTWTFADLHRAATALAGSLRDAGVRPGDRVALLAPAGAAGVVAVHAVPRAGGILTPLNSRLAPAEWRDQASVVRPAVVLGGGPFGGAAAALAGQTGAVYLALPAIPAPGAVASLPLAAPLPIVGDTVHTILFTSGTTGRAKGAMLTHGNHFASAVASALNLGVRADDRWLACLPLFHVGGLSILVRSAVYGMPVVVHPAFDPAAANRAIDEQGVTIISVVAVMLQRMLEARGGAPFPPGFRCALLGGGPAPAPLLQACRAGSVPVVTTYGLTETASQVATMTPDGARRRFGAAGRPLWGTRLRIDGAARPGDPGEIWVQGPTVMAGYFGDPRASAQTLVETTDGVWLRTGDVGSLDDEGLLTVLDRRDDLLISGGENVYPAEVEATLLTHPDVLEAGVVGLPDPVWGQRPAAAVVLRPGAATSGEAIAAWCAGRLARYKRPDRVAIVERLPRTANGKLQRAALREALRGQAPRGPA